MSSKAGTINAAIKTALEAISAGETYQNTVKGVYRVFRPPQDSEAPEDFPYINFRTITYDEERSASSRKKVHALLHLGLYVHMPDGTADDDVDDLIQSLISDVKIALDSDSSLSTNVWGGHVAEVIVAEIVADRSGFISADVVYDCWFKHTVTDPTS